LRSFFVGWEAESSAARREYHARFVQLVLDLDRTLTTSQRQRAIDQLRRYAEDCRQLSRGT
jgi:predicted HAD superfamily phosphohydrolase YqeG